MSAEAIASSRRDEEVRALMARRELCERSLKDWRPIPAYDPGNAVARAERLRRESLESDIKKCDQDIKALGKLKPAELIARFVPEVAAQERLKELNAEGYNLTDVLARGARR